MLFKFSNLNSNLAQTLGYLKPALNNSALTCRSKNETWATGGMLGFYPKTVTDPTYVLRMTNNDDMEEDEDDDNIDNDVDKLNSASRILQC